VTKGRLACTGADRDEHVHGQPGCRLNNQLNKIGYKGNQRPARQSCCHNTRFSASVGQLWHTSYRIRCAASQPVVSLSARNPWNIASHAPEADLRALFTWLALFMLLLCCTSAIFSLTSASASKTFGSKQLNVIWLCKNKRLLCQVERRCDTSA
jgi:hypothetical protein